MSKTASMAMMALNWVKGIPELKQFSFVFMIRLRYADKTSSLAELKIAQHDRLTAMSIQAEKIGSILKGITEHRTLLILDGYDEYSPGTNKDIDETIESTIGRSFIILTSRPGFLDKTARNKMKRIVIIKVFSEENIRKCCELFLGNKEKSEALLEQAKTSGRNDLVHIPIILLLSCLV